MSTNEPCQRPSTKETQISRPNPRMQAPDAGAIDPDTKGILSFATCTNWPLIPQQAMRTQKTQFLDSVLMSPSHVLFPNASHIFRAITNLVVAARYCRIPETPSALSFLQVWGQHARRSEDAFTSSLLTRRS
jgi:hypothetical protein